MTIVGELRHTISHSRGGVLLRIGYITLTAIALVLLAARANTAGLNGLRSFDAIVSAEWSLPPRILIPSLIGVALTALSPWLPAIGLYAFLAVAYSFPRDEYFSFFCRWGMIESLSLLSFVGALLFARPVKLQVDQPWLKYASLVIYVMAALAVWSMVTAAFAQARGEYHPAYNHHPLQIIDDLLLMVAAFRTIRTTGHWFAFGATLASTLALQIAAFPQLVSRNGDLGVLLAMGIPLTVVSIVASMTDRSGGVVAAIRAVAAVALVILAIGLTVVMVRSENRGGVLALAAASLVGGLFCRWRWQALAFAAWTAVGIASAVYIADPEGVATRFEQISNKSSEDRHTVDSRLRIYAAGIRMAADRPALGVGIGNFESMMDRYDPDGHSDSPHNNVIGMFAETGVLGGAFYLFIFGASIFFLLRYSLSRDVGLSEHLIAVGLASSLVAYLVAGMFMTRHTMWLAYILAGGAMGWLSHRSVAQATASSSMRMTNPAAVPLA